MRKNTHFIFLNFIAVVFIASTFPLISKLNSQFSKFYSNPEEGGGGIYQHGKPYAKQHHFLDSLSGDSTYCFNYVFKDHQNKVVTWNWSADRFFLDSLSKNYGLPLNFFEPYRATSAVKARRKRIRKRALFSLSDGYLVPDYNEIVKAHAPVTKPLYELIKTHLGDSASMEDKVEMMMKFCQDLPYKIPPAEYDGKIVEGLLPPSTSLRLGWGDCDTKAMIFASALSHDPDIKMLVLTVPNHVLMGVRGVPKPYQGFIEYQGEKYILCQPVGPARLKVGDKGSNYRPTQIITPIGV